MDILKDYVGMPATVSFPGSVTYFMFLISFIKQNIFLQNAF